MISGGVVPQLCAALFDSPLGVAGDMLKTAAAATRCIEVPQRVSLPIGLEV
jgi:hypothetical protein